MPPELWTKYCGVLGLPGPLLEAWWAALRRSPRTDAQALVQTFAERSKGLGRVDTAALFSGTAGPTPMLRLLAVLVEAGTLTRGQGAAIRDQVLALAHGTTDTDWRGISLHGLRWLTPDEVQARSTRTQKEAHACQHAATTASD